jgi:hypothetical protein
MNASIYMHEFYELDKGFEAVYETLSQIVVPVVGHGGQTISI